MSALQRLYLGEPIHIQDKICLEEDVAHYVLNVLRSKIGSEFIFFDAVNGEFLGEIISIKKKQVEVSVTKKLRDYKEPNKLKLVFSLIKQDRMGILIEKATELGVTAFQPLVTERSQVKKINLDRLRKIAIEACEQSNRLSIPFFGELITLQEYLNTNKDKSIFCCERFVQGEGVVLKNFDTVLIGPEGGFSENEKLSISRTITPISLGENILRAETAAIVAIDRVRLA